MIDAPAIPPAAAARPAASRSGFTLVEATVAAAIVIAFFAGVFACLTQSFRFIESARDLNRVAQILQSEMEDLRMRSWAELETMYQANVDRDLPFTPRSEFTSQYGIRYTCTRTMSLRSDRNDSQIEVVLASEWTDRAGAKHRKYYVSYFTKNGLNDYYYRTF